MPPPTTHLRLSRRAPRRQRVRGGTVQIVATPGSGQGRALATARRLARLLERRGYVVDVRSFADLTALTRWAEQCPPHASHVVCIGGDATLSAAAVAAIRRRVPFVPVPNGFGNVFAQVFGYSRRPNGIVYLLDEGEVCYVDVGVVKWQGHDEIFLSHRSYGFLEQVQQVAERGRKLPRRHLFRYLWYCGVANRLLLRTRLAPFRVEIDGALVADDAALVTVANVETYRGFLTLTPASCDRACCRCWCGRARSRPGGGVSRTSGRTSSRGRRGGCAPAAPRWCAQRRARPESRFRARSSGRLD